MVAKAERARRQMREAAALEFNKPAWRTWRDGIGMGPHELAELVKSFDGEITRLSPGKASGLSRSIGVEGKQRRRAHSRCYGDGRRMNSGGLLTGSLIECM